MDNFRYYCIARPPLVGGIPNSAILVDAVAFDERLYIPEIDRMAWGWVEYDCPLSIKDVADYELISAPRKDELYETDR